MRIATRGMKTRYIAFALWVVFGAAGCAHMDAKLDMAEQHLGSEPKPFYEGQLKYARKIGPMTSLAFTDGQIIDVSIAPAGLSEGDTVRIYQTDNNYEAHLWHSAKPELPSAETNTLAPALPSK